MICGAENPVYVHRTDADTTGRLEVTEDGSTWRTVWLYDQTAETDVPYGTGFGTASGAGTQLRVVRRSGLVVLQGRVARTSGTGSTVGVIPAGFRPANMIFFAPAAVGAATADGSRFLGSIGTDGTISLAQGTGSPTWTAQTWIGLNVTWAAA